MMQREITALVQDKDDSEASLKDQVERLFESLRVKDDEIQDVRVSHKETERLSMLSSLSSLR
jgi:hypothetical protein